MRLLVVDDDADSREILGVVLGDGGHEVTLADGGGEALRLCHDECRVFDGVIIDLQMPGVNGIEVMQRLRGHVDTAALPIACVSARVDLATRHAAGEAGCDCFVAKPCLPETIVAALARVMRTRGVLGPEERLA